MRVRFWGTRGSFPVPGAATLRYGGNTACLEMNAGDELVVVDAGSGLRELGRSLVQGPPRRLSLLMTHLHWDHLLGFLFFEPAYALGWELMVGGWPAGLDGLKRMFKVGRSESHFPVHWEKLAARIERSPELEPPRFSVGALQVRTTPLNHPQGGVGYSFAHHGRRLVFLTDNELDGPGPVGLDEFAEFARGADVLIHDAQFTPEEHRERRGWGHSDYAQAVELARRAEVGRLLLFHHDPGRSDDALDELVVRAQELAGPRLAVQAAIEGSELEL